MARLDQYNDKQYTPTVIPFRKFADSLRFHARLDVRSKDFNSSELMKALTSASSKEKKLTPKKRMSLIKKLGGL